MLRAWFACCVIASAWGQSFSPPRLANGHPNLQGVWRGAVVSAAFDVQAHEATYLVAAGPSGIVGPPPCKPPYPPRGAPQTTQQWGETEPRPAGCFQSSPAPP